MVASKEYTVDRLVVELTIRDQQQVTFNHEEIARACETVIPPELERILSQLCGTEEVILIGGVEVDAGPVSENELGMALADAACRQLRQRLPDLVAAARLPPGLSGSGLRTDRSARGKVLSPRSAAQTEEVLSVDGAEVDVSPIFGEEPGIAPADAACWQLRQRRPDLADTARFPPGLAESGSQTDRSGQGKVLSPRSAAREVLTHFLRTGTLPWWADRQECGRMEDLYTDMVHGDPAGVRSFASRVLGDPVAVKRFVSQFSESACAELLAVLAPDRAESIRTRLVDLVATCEQSTLPAMSTPEIRRTFWSSVLSRYGQDSEMGTLADAATEATLEALERETAMPRPAILAVLHKTAQELTREHFAFRSNLPGWLRAVASSEAQSSKDPLRHTSPRQEDTGKNRADDTRLDRLHIENAGLVLLWPYLKTFFGTLGLLQGGAFADEKAAIRAICLLQDLAAPHQEIHEYDLALCKVLCGWPVLAPLETDFRASEAERAEGDMLLRTAVSHWSALKNTSTAGLRTSFLQRKATLEEQDDGWLLYVERKAYDLLLERLPWSISVVKLPWMFKALFVEWWK